MPKFHVEGSTKLDEQDTQFSSSLEQLTDMRSPEQLAALRLQYADDGERLVAQTWQETLDEQMQGWAQLSDDELLKASYLEKLIQQFSRHNFQRELQEHRKFSRKLAVSSLFLCCFGLLTVIAEENLLNNVTSIDYMFFSSTIVVFMLAQLVNVLAEKNYVNEFNLLTLNESGFDLSAIAENLGLRMNGDFELDELIHILREDKYGVIRRCQELPAKIAKIQEKEQEAERTQQEKALRESLIQQRARQLRLEIDAESDDQDQIQ